jgi:hypothetical protein
MFYDMHSTLYGFDFFGRNTDIHPDSDKGLDTKLQAPITLSSAIVTPSSTVTVHQAKYFP